MALAGLLYEFGVVTSVTEINYTPATTLEKFVRLYRNSVSPANLLVDGVDYNHAFDDYGVYVINFNLSEIPKFGNSYIVEFYDPTFTTLLDTATFNVLPRFGYISLLAPDNNNIGLSETTNKATELDTAYNIDKCNTVSFRGYVLNIVTLAHNQNTINQTRGVVRINGTVVSDLDIVNSSPSGATVFDTGGVLKSQHLNLSASLLVTGSQSIIVEYTHNNTNTENDLSIAINNYGFTKIGSDGNIAKFGLLHEGGQPYSAPDGLAKFEVELTSSQYIMRVNGVVIRTVNRTVQYTSLFGKGDVNIAVQPLGSNGSYGALSSGIDYISANIDDGIRVLQKVNNQSIAAPIFNLASITPTCPIVSFNLGNLILTNPTSGFSLKWYSDTALINEVTNLLISSTTTLYAAFESDVYPGCFSEYTSFTVTINDCVAANDDSFSTPSGVPININISTNDVLCNGQTTTFEIVTQPNPLHGTISNFNASTGTLTFTPTNGYLGNAVFTYKIKCNGVDKDTATVTIAINGYCNESFTITKQRNNCPSGTPQSVSYTVPANSFCGNYSSQGDANWAAYIGSLTAAQTYANANALCVACSGANPCVTEYEVGRIVVRGTPGSIAKVYKGDLVLFEMPIPATGELEIKHDFLIGEIYVTLTGLDNVESQKQCLPINLISLEDKCNKCKKCKKCECK